MQPNISEPDKILNDKDPGDDVQRRFRYQASYAAVLSLNMILDSAIIAEVFCELHEDILIKLLSGKYIGIQVKTKQLHLGPFDFNDDEITKSIKRFIYLDLKFVDQFDAFTIASNSGFSLEKSKNLNKICELAKNRENDLLLKPRTSSKKWIESVSKDCKCTVQNVIDVLAKLRLRGGLSTLEDMGSKVFQLLTEINDLKSQTAGTLNSITTALIAKHMEAASLAHNSPLSEYFILSENAAEEKVNDIISGKRITKTCISKIIQEAISDPIKLFIKDSQGLNNLPKGVKRLETKMDAGGISIDNIQLSKDQKYSFEAHTASWLYKMDATEASQKYDQIKLIVQNECQEAYDETKKEDQLYGTNMLVEIRKRLRQRHSNEPQKFFDCHYDHLLGLVGSLTEECKVWWSNKFQID